MPQVSLGDMTQTWLLRRQNAAMKQQLTTLGQEVTSERTANVTRHLSGNFNVLSSIERDLHVLTSYQTTLTEARGYTEALQSSLGHIQDLAAGLSTNLLQANGPLAAMGETLAVEAEDIFHTIVSTLNGQFAGRSLFAGQATNQPALASAQSMLTSLRTAIGADLSPANITATIDTWFGAGGDFETLGYQGSDAAPPSFRLSNTDSLSVDFQANGSEIRQLLRFVATAAIAADTTTSEFRSSLLKSAGEGLLTADDALIKLRANLGFKEQSILQAQTQHAAENASLTMAYNDLLGVDPYQAATELQNVEIRLQTLYAITVRLSNLSLVRFMS